MKKNVSSFPLCIIYITNYSLLKRSLCSFHVENSWKIFLSIYHYNVCEVWDISPKTFSYFSKCTPANYHLKMRQCVAAIGSTISSDSGKVKDWGNQNSPSRYGHKWCWSLCRLVTWNVHVILSRKLSLKYYYYHWKFISGRK